MNEHRQRKWPRIVGIIIFLYIVIGVALYFFQEKILLHAKTLPAGYRFSFSIPSEEVNLQVDDKTILNLVKFKTSVPRKGIVLYFHGNKDNIEHYAAAASAMTRNGYELWMMDYPGFGKSTGKFTEDGAYKDALLVYQMARAQVAKDSIIVYGRSLGTGIATELASVRDCKRLILETPYYSIDALCRHYAFIYPVSTMLKFHFPTNEFLMNVDAPVTIFHGTNDEMIPYRQAEKLQALKPGIELVKINKGKHNNLAEFPEFQAKLDSLLR